MDSQRGKPLKLNVNFLNLFSEKASSCMKNVDKL